MNRRLDLLIFVLLIILINLESYTIERENGLEEKTSKYIYVSISGRDSNDGLSPKTPVKSIPKAVLIAISKFPLESVEIRIESGIYTPGNGLEKGRKGISVRSKSNLLISGGWNKDFTIVSNPSILDGKGQVCHVISIENVTNIVLRNLIIRGGNANVKGSDDGRGGGLYISHANFLKVESNVILESNVAIDGGGVFVGNSQSILLECVIRSNRSVLYGGGISGYFSHNNIFKCNIFGNESGFGGGGIILNFSVSNFIACNVYGNNANDSGGGLSVIFSSDNKITGDIYGNFADKGGGLILTSSKSNSIDIVLRNNKANSHGAGMYLDASEMNIIKGNIVSNIACKDGGGLYLYNSSMNTIDGNVSFNNAVNGGGVYLYRSDYFTNKGKITANSANNGGGILAIYSGSNSYFGNVNKNYPNDVIVLQE